MNNYNKSTFEYVRYFLHKNKHTKTPKTKPPSFVIMFHFNNKMIKIFSYFKVLEPYEMLRSYQIKLRSASISIRFRSLKWIFPIKYQEQVSPDKFQSFLSTEKHPQVRFNYCANNLRCQKQKIAMMSSIIIRIFDLPAFTNIID